VEAQGIEEKKFANLRHCYSLSSFYSGENLEDEKKK